MNFCRKISAIWRKFFFSEIDARQFAALRIVFGLLALYMLTSYLTELTTFLSNAGLAPMPWTEFKSRWSMFYFFSSQKGALAFLLFGILSSMAMIIGVKSRLATWLTFAAVVSVANKSHVPYGAYGILQSLLFYIGLGESGKAWSLDSCSRKSRSRVAIIWPLRLIQIQIGVIYFCNGYAKIHGVDWIDGSAVARVLQLFNPGLMKFFHPHLLALTHYGLITVTYLTIIWELTFPLLLLSRKTRWSALAIGVAVHSGIMLFMGLWFFGLIMIATYISLLPIAPWQKIEDTIKAATVRLNGLPRITSMENLS